MEYETSPRPHRGDRLAVYGLFVHSLILVFAAHLYFGGDVWITRLTEYMAGGAFIWALVQLAVYRYDRRMRRDHDGCIDLGNKNLHWSSDRDPDDRRVL